MREIVAVALRKVANFSTLMYGWTASLYAVAQAKELTYDELQVRSTPFHPWGSYFTSLKTMLESTLKAWVLPARGLSTTSTSD